MAILSHDNLLQSSDWQGLLVDRFSVNQLMLGIKTLLLEGELDENRFDWTKETRGILQRKQYL